VRGVDSVGVAIILWVIGSIIVLMAFSIYLELGLSTPKYRLRGHQNLVSVPRSGGEKNYVGSFLKFNPTSKI
jgi:hypothetical protein